MSTAVKRACDACHRRKVKCDGMNPCRNCGAAQLSCTYNAIPQKKGPKGSRAKVISELRETQRQTSLSAKVQNRINGCQPTPPSPSLNPTPGLLTGKIVKVCVDYFFENMYATTPILDRTQVEQQISCMETDRDVYCMLASLCAFVTLQPGLVLPDMLDGEGQNLAPEFVNLASSQLLMEEALRVRKGLEYLDNITYNGLVTNFFFLGCCYAFEMHDKAWCYLREATTMIHLANMTDDSQLQAYSPGDSARRRRLFWLFYAHERAHAIQRHRPVTLQATMSCPRINDDPSEACNEQLEPFMLLANLFRPMDHSFMATWQKARVHSSAQSIAGLQKQLSNLRQQYSPQDYASERQASREWIDHLLWTHRGGSMNNTDNASMAYQYNSMQVAREQLMAMASSYPANNMDRVDHGFIEHLLETTTSLMKILVLLPAPSDPFRISPNEYLEQLIGTVSMIRRGSYHFLPLLAAKVNEILPRLVNPMVQRAPEVAPQMMMMMGADDMFDGFGNAGMAQVPQIPMSIEDNDYDQKFKPEDYDQQFANMNSQTPESSQVNMTPPSMQQSSGMSNPFGGSPGVMSPGLEYQHGMNNFNAAPISDMMSPLGNTSQPDPMNQLQSHQQHQLPNNQQHIAPDGMLGNMMFHYQQPPQRQASFQIQNQQAPLGTVGNYQAMPRSNIDVSNSLGINEMDYTSLQ